MSNRFTFRYQNLLEIKVKYEELAQQKFNEALMVLDNEKKNWNHMKMKKEKILNCFS